MKIILLIIVMFFACYGLIDIIFKLTVPHRCKNNQYMVIMCDNTSETLEFDMRSLLKKYSDCDIVVINDCNDNNEINEILKNFSKDYQRVHILKKAELPNIFD